MLLEAFEWRGRRVIRNRRYTGNGEVDGEVIIDGRRLLSMGLLAACGETAPGRVMKRPMPSLTPRADAVENGGTDTVAANATEAAAATAPNPAPEPEKPASVASLPLKRGFYVASDTPCGQASNATLTLLRRDGFGGSRDFCEFAKIEKAGAASCRITEKCGDLQAGPDSEFTQAVAWEIPGDTQFRRKTDSGWESSARYCAQSSLPEPWRDNDISDLINRPAAFTHRRCRPARLRPPSG